MMAVFGGLRAVFPLHDAMALIGTIGIPIGQPFLLNAFTKLAALWFPKKSEGHCHGSYLSGHVSGHRPRRGGQSRACRKLWLFRHADDLRGLRGCVSPLFLVFAKSEPPTPASPPGEEVRALVLDGLKKILRQRDVYFLCLALFIGSSGIGMAPSRSLSRIWKKPHYRPGRNPHLGASIERYHRECLLFRQFIRHPQSGKLFRRLRYYLRFRRP